MQNYGYAYRFRVESLSLSYECEVDLACLASADSLLARTSSAHIGLQGGTERRSILFAGNRWAVPRSLPSLAPYRPSLPTVPRSLPTCPLRCLANFSSPDARPFILAE